MPSEAANRPIVSSLSDDADMLELVQMYVDMLPERLAAMREALEHSDLQQLQQLAHQLKGSGGSHGFAILSEKAALLESACKAEALQQAQGCLEEIAGLMARVRAQ